MALAKGLIDSRTPTFGICLGHQLLALALGLKVEKMMFGHHGGNHPVRDLELGKNLITSQNHGYCVMLSPQDEARHPIKVTHRNLNDGSVEGFRHTHLPVAAVQFHPEAAPGPHDAHYLFERFLIGLTQTPPLAVC
jgi:carbamoyl-phosphate synthase small subunit